MIGEEEYVRIKSEDPSGIDILHHFETEPSTPSLSRRLHSSSPPIPPPRPRLQSFSSSIPRPRPPPFTPRRDAASTPRLHRRTAEPGPRPLTSLVACGKGAGAFTCLLDETGRYDSPPYKNVEYKPDYKVSSLVEVHKLLEKDFSLYPYSHK
ncbi:phosphoglycolate phosphatase [Striga asiatica]|uniref:Phosphoglycolate phosphatase n=1 Tax=Striga asiatica TaxID=4170 RepID=A0A5A7Q9U4_STRAF|nr:phosphoglycolate phosphatase [Striga asiatica]